jgi:hypothetical protein
MSIIDTLLLILLTQATHFFNFNFIYIYFDKIHGRIRIVCYEFHYNPEYIVTKLHNSKLLLDKSLYKLYNNIDYALLHADNHKNPPQFNMPMHRHASYDIIHEIFNNINSVIPIYYITTGLVIILGV